MASTAPTIAVSRPVRWRSTLWRLVRTVFVVAVLGYIASRLDLQALATQVRSVQPGFIVLGFAVWLASLLVATLRWYILARSVTSHVSFVFLLRYSFVGIFYSQFLPSSISGDVVRGYYVARARTDKAAMFSSSLVERVIGMATNGVVGLLALCAAPEILTLFGLDGNAALGLALLAVVGAGAGFLFLRRFKLRTKRLPRALVMVYETLSTYARKPAALGLSMVLSIVYFLLWAAILWFFGLAVGIKHLSFNTYMLIVVAINVAQFLPLTINGWGVREGALVALLSLYDVPAEMAVLLSLLWAVLVLVAAVIGGFQLLIDRKSDNV